MDAPIRLFLFTDVKDVRINFIPQLIILYRACLMLELTIDNSLRCFRHRRHRRRKRIRRVSQPSSKNPDYRPVA